MSVSTARSCSRASHEIDFRIERDIHWKYKESLPYHPNALTLFARDAGGELLREATFYSVGGGFVVSDEEAQAPATATVATTVPLPFSDAAELLKLLRAMASRSPK